MKTTLSVEARNEIAARLDAAADEHASLFPGTSGRQPVHVVYGGAQLFSSEIARKLGTIARRSVDTYAPSAVAFANIFGIPDSLAETVYSRVNEKLLSEPVEDLRVDFEDGYGVRSEADEDEHAVAAARETEKAISAGILPPFFGIRIKSLNKETYYRAIRTLDLYLTELVGSSGDRLPANFVVTLPKVVSTVQVAALDEVLTSLETRLGLERGNIKVELMVETSQSIVALDGTFALPKLVVAGNGRVAAAHFGAYDYTADLGVISSKQDLRHPACDFARQVMQVSLAGTGIHLSDGATNIMPVGPHRGDKLTEAEMLENKNVVHAAWKLHYDNCRHALDSGFYQGWDLHPAQIPARYAAVYTFFLEGLTDAAERLKSFIDKGARANLVGNTFDDAATGQGLLNFFLRAINCGATKESDALDEIGIGLDELRRGSFAAILEGRKGI